MELTPLLGGDNTTPLATGNGVVDAPDRMSSTAGLNSTQSEDVGVRSQNANSEQTEDFEGDEDFGSSMTITV